LKPIQIISHVACEQPGYLCEYLNRQGIPFENISIERGDTVPTLTDDISGIALLGSPFSVNDPYPWIADEIALIRHAAQQDAPVLGICFGGQLISKALGGTVRPSTSMQIGWDNVRMTQQGENLFGKTDMPDSFEAFEWHGEAFSLPPGSKLLFSGDCIKNQGFLLRNCLALQFHLEITDTMIHEWMNRYAHCLDNSSGCIQSRDQLLGNIGERLVGQRRVADKIFAWWLDRVHEYSAGLQE